MQFLHITLYLVQCTA